MIYRLRFTKLAWGLIPLYDKLPEGLRDPRARVGPEVDEGWTPPPLMLIKARGKAPSPDIWDYDQGFALAVTGRVAAALEGESWCRLFPFRAEVQVGSKAGNWEQVDRVLVAVTLAIDVMDSERTVYKSYGERVLDLNRAGAIVVDEGRLPSSGLFQQPSGASHLILATDGFRKLVESHGWTGLEFTPIGCPVL